MPTNYTTIGPITAKIAAEGLEQPEDVTVVAFGWTNAEPEQITGVWVLGAAGAPGLAFFPGSQIQSLEPTSGASERAIMIAADALERADRAREERDEAVREALVAEVVAAVESRAAAEAAKSESEARRSSSRRSSARKPPDRKPARRSVKGR